jgi:hypothetical protein
MTSPHKPLSQIHPNFTEMFLWWSTLKMLFKEFNSMQNSGCHGNQKKKLTLQILLKKPQD